MLRLLCSNVTSGRNTEVETWYLVSRLCLCDKNVVVLFVTLPRKLGHMFVVKDFTRNVKMKLGSLLKNIYKAKYFSLLIKKVSI